MLLSCFRSLINATFFYTTIYNSAEQDILVVQHDNYWTHYDQQTTYYSIVFSLFSAYWLTSVTDELENQKEKQKKREEEKRKET